MPTTGSFFKFIDYCTCKVIKIKKDITLIKVILGEKAGDNYFKRAQFGA